MGTLRTPEPYELWEKLDVDYVIRLKANQRLQRMAREFEDVVTCKIDIYEGYHVFYKEITYKAGSWDKERKVMLKLKKPTDELLFTPTFIVTTLGDTLGEIVDFYSNRGIMEN